MQKQLFSHNYNSVRINVGTRKTQGKVLPPKMKPMTTIEKSILNAMQRWGVSDTTKTDRVSGLGSADSIYVDEGKEVSVVKENLPFQFQKEANQARPAFHKSSVLVPLSK